MKTDYNDLIPPGIIFNLVQIEQMGLIKVAMLKKLIAKRELEIVKVGQKIHISRQQLIHFMESNTINAAH